MTIMYPSLTTFPGDLFAEIDAIHRQLGRMFGVGEWPSSIRATARGTFPAVNMGTTEDAVEIYAFVPGLDPAKIDLTVEKGLLVISGERASGLPEAAEPANLYAQERFAGGFKRVVSLPEEVDSTRIEATYRNGVLRIAVPKRESIKPRRIEVKGLEKLEHKQ
jgi:HSP20 family protein